jgi:hypothetical protein
MDSKGETIYRRRPFYYVLEKMTLAHLKEGGIEDDIVKRLVATRTPLVTMRRMPEDVRRFMQDNYLPIAWRLRVLGQEFPPRNFRALGPIGFKVRIPARYTFVSADGPVPGKLDGVDISGPCELGEGRHEFLPAPQATGKIAMIWARAIEQGYSPFTPIKQDVTTPQD